MNTEPIHGTYSLEKRGNLIVCFYSEGFNLAGVKAITNDILALAEDLDLWALYQKPDSTAGIVHNAIKAMMDGYVRFQNAGCVAAAIQENSIFVRAGTSHRPHTLKMPIKIDKSEEELLLWLQAQLSVNESINRASAQLKSNQCVFLFAYAF